MNLIKLALEVSVPVDRWEHCYERTWKTPFKNKYVEVSTYKRNSIVSFYLEWSLKEDHAGFMVELDLLGFGAAFNLYDCRHWDYENNCWEEN